MFNVVNLNKEQWAITLIISILPIPIMELQKKLNRIQIKREKKIFIRNTLNEANKG